MRVPDQANSTPRKRSVYLETFGCQMNELDSELVRGQLHALGYNFTQDAGDADIVLYNTCSVREQAENKVYSRVGLHGKAKHEGSEVLLGVIGCMAERDGADMIRRFPQIDLLCGPGELDKLPMLIDNAFKAQLPRLSESTCSVLENRIALQGSQSRRSQTLAAAEDDLEMLDLSRSFDPDAADAGGRSAYVRITRGCNKFCTYCVVPHTRGAEVHRPPDAIVEECQKLADAGVTEITLLGQTVNHYRYTHGIAVSMNGHELPQVGPGLSAFRDQRSDDSITGGAGFQPAASVRSGSKNRELTKESKTNQTTTFADLLARIHDEVPAIARLRFVTSYPRDFGDDALAVMAASPRICRYLHVPAQSGSNRILRKMNRGYTVEQYLDFIDRARGYMPDVSIAGDFIVGFPTESDEDFQQTRELLRRVRFKNNFIFKYSPRPGTIAYDRIPDDVPEEVKRQRCNELLALQADISAEVHAEWIGRTVEVFVEQISRKSAKANTGPNRNVQLGWETPCVQMSGRTGGDLITVFDLPRGASPDDFTGSIVPVEITGAGPLLLKGSLAAVEANQRSFAVDKFDRSMCR